MRRVSRLRSRPVTGNGRDGADFGVGRGARRKRCCRIGTDERHRAAPKAVRRGVVAWRGDPGHCRLRVWALILSLTACQPSTGPNDLQLAEEPSARVANGAQSGGAVRWEGESDWFFTSHPPGAPGLMANDKAWLVYLSNVPIRLAIEVGGATPVAAAIGDSPDDRAFQYAYQLGPRAGGNPNNANDLRNHLYLSPPTQPTLLDHGKVFDVTVIDRGGSDYTGAPTRNAYKFRYVAPGRCTIGRLAATPATVAPNTSVTVALQATGDCKRVWLYRISGGVSAGPVSNAAPRPPADALFDTGVRPGLGSSANASSEQLVGASRTSFRAIALDAMGRSDSDTVSVNVQTPTNPVPRQCPANSDGLPKSFNFCVSCPSGVPNSSNNSLIVGDYCDEAAGRADITPQFGGCTITTGPC